MGINNGKTIQIYLPDGDPRGIRIAEITTRLVKAIQIPQVQLSQLQNIKEASQPTCYFLFGESQETGRPTVYIGQSENFSGRLLVHGREKDFNTAVMVVSSSDSFTQTHIKYLESHSIQIARERDRYVLVNTKDESKPHVNEPMEADILDAFLTIETLLTTLGFPVFEQLVSSDKFENDSDRANEYRNKKHHVFKCSGQGGDARGELNDEGFVIFKNSIIRKEVVPSMQSYAAYMQKRDALCNEGVLVDHDSGNYILTKDLLLSTPTAAANLVLGNSSNGWKSWVSEDNGKSLHEVYRTPFENKQQEFDD
ncbi:GIY-YIG nuclease family protein [Fundidesulfovibrio butyratiphilus]